MDRDIRRHLCSGRDNKFKDGAIYFQTGANAGPARRSLSHTYNTPTAGVTRVTFTSAFTNALSLTDDFLIIASRNGVWMYDVESDEERGSDLARGRWYASSGESPPDIIDYTVPGAHQPYLYKDGRDKKGQPRYSRITSGGDLIPTPCSMRSAHGNRARALTKKAWPMGSASRRPSRSRT
jgi:hypothetical protein